MSRARALWAGRGLLGLVATIFILNVVWIARHHQALRPMSAGDLAPGLSLPRIDHAGAATGGVVDLASLRGRVVLIDFWASWCKPCRDAMPMLEHLYRELHGRGLELVSIKMDGGDMGAAGIVIAATSFPLVLDDELTSARYKVTNLPHLVIVDRQGVVRAIHRGGSGASELRGQILRLIDRPADLGAGRRVDK